jgi:hypothetical protein
MFKDHFLAILAGVNSAFPRSHFPHTFGSFFFHRPNSPSIFPDRHCSIQGSVHGTSSKVTLTSTRHRLARLVDPSSSMQSRPLNIVGISVQSGVFILSLPLTPTTVSSWSISTPKAKSSQIRSSFDMHASPSLCLPLWIGSSMACKASQVPSGEPHLPRASPNLRLFPIFRISSNHGAFLLLCPSSPPTSPLQHIQGWTCRHLQGWPLPCPQVGPLLSHPAQLGVLHHAHPPPLALHCLSPHHFKLRPGVSTLVMRHL